MSSLSRRLEKLEAARPSAEAVLFHWTMPGGGKLACISPDGAIQQIQSEIEMESLPGGFYWLDSLDGQEQA